MACWHCGLLFAYPQPPVEALEAYYGPEGDWRAKRSGREVTEAHTKGKGKAGQAVADLLDRCVTSRPRSVFDFGCGTGSWLNTLQDRGWETCGLEPSSDAAFARHRRLLDVPADERFDLVMAYHVLEHVPRPLDTLRLLAGAVRVGGYCFVSVPRLDKVLEHSDTRYCLYPPHHIVAFTEACLCGLLARAGLEVVYALHELDGLFTKGEPLRLRLLARKGNGEVSCADPAAALRAVLLGIPALFPEGS
jgi:SAM-dependent methyltransferase